MKMRDLLLIAGMIGIAGAAHAADKASYDAAMAAAGKTEAHAKALQSRWVPTEAALKAARAAAAAGDFARATALAQRAEALAAASVAQAKEQKTLWHAAVLR